MEENYHNPNEHWYYHQKLLKSGDDYKTCLVCFLGIIFLLFIAAMFSGCKNVQYIPVETVKTEYITKIDTVLQKDSVVFHDSVYIHSKGDTVWYEKWHTKYQDRIVYKTKVDSFIRTDSVMVPYPVEKQLTKWEKAKMSTGSLAIIGLSIIIIIFVVRFVLRIRGNI